MKTIKIKYNPYLLSTEILVNDKAPKPNSALHFQKIRIQEWAGRLPDILVAEYNDKNFDVEFTGTQTDYDDLVIALEANNNKISSRTKHYKKPDVHEVEDEVDKIFQDIKNGPVPQMYDDSIVAAFEKAKNQEFEVNVVATMSSGKSTLINALLDKKLMPVANMATTATIVRVINTEQENFTGIAYNSHNEELLHENNLTYKIMREWNSNKDISSIDIYGRIPFVSSVGMKLILVDTPGPNNSCDENHKRLTYKMLSDSDKSLVLFVLNAQQLNVNDEKDFMDYVCECMKSGGKQSRERYIFAVNKMDCFNPEEESIEDALVQAKSVLESRGIMDPNIFPVSSGVAFECRTSPMYKTYLPVFKEHIQHFSALKFDNYYNFNNLPHTTRLKINNHLQKVSEDEKVEIHSGIVSIEEAISLYVNKYARTLKVYDLVQSFNNRLTEMAAIANLQDEIRHSESKKMELTEKITTLRSVIESGQSAKLYHRIIDKKDMSKDVKIDIEEHTSNVQNKINKIIYDNSNATKVPKAEAAKQVDAIRAETTRVLTQLDTRVDAILSKSFRMLYDDILEEYKEHIKSLGVGLDGESLNLRPFDFVAEDLANIDVMLRDGTVKIDEGNTVSRTITETYNEKKTNWFFTPWNWCSDRYETKEREKQIEEWVEKYVDYVDLSWVISQYLGVIQTQIIEVQMSAEIHAQKESARIKKVLKDVLGEINSILEFKLKELEESINNEKLTSDEIERQNKNLKWMKEIILRVNQLIKF